MISCFLGVRRNIRQFLSRHAPKRAPTTLRAAPHVMLPAKLPAVVIGKHGLSLKSHSVQSLEALADVEPLWGCPKQIMKHGKPH